MAPSFTQHLAKVVVAESQSPAKADIVIGINGIGLLIVVRIGYHHPFVSDNGVAVHDADILDKRGARRLQEFDAVAQAHVAEVR